MFEFVSVHFCAINNVKLYIKVSMYYLTDVEVMISRGENKKRK